MGNRSNRSVCNVPVESCANLCSKKCERYASSLHERVQSPMELSPRLGISASLSDSSSTGPSQFRKRNLHFYCTQVGESLLESGPQGSGYGVTHTDLESTTPSCRRPIPATFTSCKGSTFGGMENTEWVQVIAQWPQEYKQLLESAWRQSSLKTYSAPWKCWLIWSREHDVCPHNPAGADVARYLSYLHRVRRLAPSTIKLHESVVATLANPLESETISNHTLVKHMIKAIDLSKPMTNKKLIWNVDSLVEWMKANEPDEQSVFQVSRRLALILLLASGRRIHDLTLLRIDDEKMTLNGDSVTFWPIFGSKTDSSSYRQSGWKLSRVSDSALDPIFWTTRLIAVTTGRRQAANALYSLFITSRGKVGPASRTVIAGWVSTAFTEAGIVASPGSIRSAVASSRFHNELALDVILQNGNWKRKENFFKFYFKEVQRQPPSRVLGGALTNRTFSPI